jgi:hypothetical protein
MGRQASLKRDVKGVRAGTLFAACSGRRTLPLNFAAEEPTAGSGIAVLKKKVTDLTQRDFLTGFISYFWNRGETGCAYRFCTVWKAQLNRNKNGARR